MSIKTPWSWLTLALAFALLAGCPQDDDDTAVDDDDVVADDDDSGEDDDDVAPDDDDSAPDDDDVAPDDDDSAPDDDDSAPDDDDVAPDDDDSAPDDDDSAPDDDDVAPDDDDSAPATADCVTDFWSCSSPGDCIEVEADCCGCANGGANTAINVACVGAWMANVEALYGPCSNIGCLTVYLCNGSVARCETGICTYHP